MNAIDGTDFRTIIEDARARHSAVVALIYFTDTQAMNLLRLYLTVGIATVSGAAALLPRTDTLHFVGYALAAASVVLVIGSGFCMRAMQSGLVNLPGRPADFWSWAIRPDVDHRLAITEYLKNLEEKGALNDALSARNAWALTYAKACSVVTPCIAFAVWAAALALKL